MARTKVPRRTADRVLFASDHKCSVCQGEDVQIHHLNGDPSDHAEDNLAVLCLRHHNAATAKPGFARGYSEGELRLHRNAWVDRVAKERHPEIRSSNFPRSDLVIAAIDAAVILEVERVKHGWLAARGDWDERGTMLDRLHPLISAPTGTAGLHLLEAIARFAGDTRDEMPVSLAWALVYMTLETLEVWTPDAPRDVDDEWSQQLVIAVRIANSIAYDGIRYNQQLRIVEAGGELLWWVRRIALSNAVESVERETGEVFSRLLETVKHSGFDTAGRVLQLQLEHANSGEHGPVDYPEDLVESLMS